jgi:hypothetical protein
LNVKKPPYIFNRYVNEFLKLLVPDSHHEFPIDYRDVKTNSKRFIHEHRKFMEVWSDARFIIKSFLKREPLERKIGHPRIISTVPLSHKFRLLSYVNSAAEYLKRFHWYAFGQSPIQLFEKMHLHLSKFEFLLEVDFTKFDGSFSPFFHKILRGFFLRLFHLSCHRDIDDLLKNERNFFGVSTSGFYYFGGSSTPSGTPRTSLGNSLVNAFVAYCCFRFDGKDSFHSFNDLGFYGGDDGITPDVSSLSMEKTCEAFGLEVKMTRINKHGYFSFLGRIFLDIWSGIDSMTDLRKQLSKFNLTIADSTVPDSIVLVRKAQSFLATDPNTPILTHLCELILDEFEDDHNIKYDYSSERYYFGSTPIPMIQDIDLSYVIASEILNMDLRDLDILNLASLEDLWTSNIPVLHELDVKYPAIVDGDILSPKEEIPKQESKKKRYGQRKKRTKKSRKQVVSGRKTNSDSQKCTC